MKNAPIAIVIRWAAGAVCLAFVLWSLPGCGGNEDGHDEAGHSHSSADEPDTHDHDETESGAHAHDEDETGSGADAHEDETESGAHGHDEADGEHAHGREFVEPKTLGDAVHMIQESMEAIEDALAENRLGDIHSDAEIITNAAQLVGQLALADGSGVARDAVRDVNVAGRELATASDALHEASDDGDRSKSQTEFDRMKTHVEALSQYAGPADDHDHEGDPDHHDDSDHDHS